MNIPEIGCIPGKFRHTEFHGKCQRAKEEVYFEEILAQLYAEMKGLSIKKLPKPAIFTNRETFRRQFLALFEHWKQTGRREPILIIFDEVDKLFAYGKMGTDQETLAEYVQIFRMLRGLAQSQRALVILVVAYRPDINRYNLLSPEVDENPMYMSFQEEYLGFLDYVDSEKMIHEIGGWKDIVWDEDAAQRVFYYCGGHPLITRFFAGEACQKGILKHIKLERVEHTAQKICKNLRRHQIGIYYKEGIWETLREDEQELLLSICRKDNQRCFEKDISEKQEEALTNLEHFGLVTNTDDLLCLSANLFDSWLQRRI